MELNDIKSPADIKKMSIDQLQELADGMREALIKKVASRGGHVGPNLGFLEATIAMHYVFDAPEDKIVYDVSHQSYPHKMLTGRMEAFTDPEKYGTVTGYTNPNESEYDLFTVGHTSTAVSLAGGLAKARDMRGGKENIIAVVGDGSLSGGEAFEGLDWGATLGTNFIVVVNDNDMSIAENHGGLYADLRLLRNTKGTAELNYFRSLGYAYRYVHYGNDLRTLIKAFSEVKDYPYPVVLHLNTMKGNGYAPAEAHKEAFHWSMPFDVPSGELLSLDDADDYTDIFAKLMIDEVKSNGNVAVITAGTPGAIGFTPDRRKEAGRQFIDVGIAEQEAVALASGMAKGGARPVFGVISSFLQRAYDQLSQDVAINNTPVVLSIFAGSVMGLTDVTHLGWFDVALVANIPGWVVLAPTCREEYEAMMKWAIGQTDYPVAVRVPGGQVVSRPGDYDIDYGKLNRSEVVKKGSEVAIIAAGAMLQNGMSAARLLAGRGIDATVINPRYMSGLDTELLEELKRDHRLVITVEDGVLEGGYGEKVARYYGDSDIKVKCLGVDKKFRDRYNVKALLEECHLTADGIASQVD